MLYSYTRGIPALGFALVLSFAVATLLVISLSILKALSVLVLTETHVNIVK